jgi:hypothetical protein
MVGSSFTAFKTKLSQLYSVGQLPYFAMNKFRPGQLSTVQASKQIGAGYESL